MKHAKHTKHISTRPIFWDNYGTKIFNFILTGNSAVSLRDIKDYKEYTNKVKGKCN